MKSLLTHTWHGGLWLASLLAHAGDLVCVVLATLTFFVATVGHETSVWLRKQKIWTYDRDWSDCDEYRDCWW